MSSTTLFDSSALIPWYLNGTLTTEEHHAVETWLIASGSDVELQVWRAVQQQVRTRESPAKRVALRHTSSIASFASSAASAELLTSRKANWNAWP